MHKIRDMGETAPIATCQPSAGALGAGEGVRCPGSPEMQGRGSLLSWRRWAVMGCQLISNPVRAFKGT